MTTLFSDNQSAITLTQDHQYHPRIIFTSILLVLQFVILLYRFTLHFHFFFIPVSPLFELCLVFYIHFSFTLFESAHLTQASCSKMTIHSVSYPYAQYKYSRDSNLYSNLLLRNIHLYYFLLSNLTSLHKLY